MFILVCFTATGLPSNPKATFMWFASKASQDKSIWYADDFIVWLCICSSARKRMSVTLCLMHFWVSPLCPNIICMRKTNTRVSVKAYFWKITKGIWFIPIGLNGSEKHLLHSWFDPNELAASETLWQFCMNWITFYRE